MDVITYSDFRANLAATLDQVNDDHSPVLITRQKGKPAIVMSVDDFNSFKETAYLMSSPKNAQALNEAIARVEAGETEQHELIDV